MMGQARRFSEAGTDLGASFPEMNVNRLTLAFEDDLESAFQEDHFDSSIGLLRTSFVLGVLY